MSVFTLNLVHVDTENDRARNASEKGDLAPEVSRLASVLEGVLALRNELLGNLGVRFHRANSIRAEGTARHSNRARRETGNSGTEHRHGIFGKTFNAALPGRPPADITCPTKPHIATSAYIS